jgi:ABC-type molybdenum transport system ATPase subunit/photorepair protein PhrA
MLFSGDEGMKPTHALSGGEAVRLLFAKLMLTKDNVLVLDEPTNHLDLESIVALGEAWSATRAPASSSPTTATSSPSSPPACGPSPRTA